MKNVDWLKVLCCAYIGAMFAVTYHMGLDTGILKGRLVGQEDGYLACRLNMTYDMCQDFCEDGSAGTGATALH